MLAVEVAGQPLEALLELAGLVAAVTLELLMAARVMLALLILVAGVAVALHLRLEQRMPAALVVQVLLLYRILQPIKTYHL